MTNCKQVAELLSRSMDGELTLRQYLIMRLHLMLCSMCRRYAQQLLFLRTAARKLAGGIGRDDTGIARSQAARQRIPGRPRRHPDGENDR